MLKFTSPYTGVTMNAGLTRNAYSNNGRLFLGLMTFDMDDYFWEPWCDLTVNLPFAPLTDETCGYVDTNNNAPLAQMAGREPSGKTNRQGGRQRLLRIPGIQVRSC